MITAMYVEVNAVGLLLLAVVSVCHRRNSMNSLSDKAFSCLCRLLEVLLVADALLWVVDGVVVPGSRLLADVSGVLCFSAIPMMGYMGWIYVVCFMRAPGYLTRKRFLVYAVPMLFGISVVVINLFTGCLFVMDAQNVYHRTSTYFLTLIAPCFYIFSAAYNVLHMVRKRPELSVRQQCASLALYIFLPFAGYLLQFLFYGISLGPISFALALTVMFISMQNMRISMDTLTGINNRTRLQQFLSASVREMRPDDVPMYALMIDVDDFKHFNDRFGHTTGDDALICTANILKSACAEQSDFIARYGGDEFVLICRRGSDAAMHSLLGYIGNAVERFNEQANKQYRLSLSIGMTQWEPGMDSIALLSAADARMYRTKMAHKEAVSAVREQ
ncbi:MAG: diguanylate cyclase [Eubacteriales bacterium]|nr:diguanylate cyclase [Eubacteriales bacterium]